jgi:hypothetical protein
MPLSPRYVDISTAGTLSNWALPAGTEIGDSLLVWGMASIFTVTDARFTTYVPHASGTEQGGFWIGKATALAPIAGTMTAGTGIRSANGRIVTFRDRIIARRIGTKVDGGSSPTYPVPTVPGDGSGAIVLSVGWAGIGGTGPVNVSGGDTWTSEATNSSYDAAGHAWTTAAPLTGDAVTVTWPIVSAPITFASLMIATAGGGYAPPCRNIKRGDVLDLGGARNYPPSKMTQTSSRGVGAY